MRFADALCKIVSRILAEPLSNKVTVDIDDYTPSMHKSLNIRVRRLKESPARIEDEIHARLVNAAKLVHAWQKAIGGIHIDAHGTLSKHFGLSRALEFAQTH